MSREHLCANCHAVKFWGRWCRDCVRMVAKTILAEVVAVAVAYALGRLLG